MLPEDECGPVRDAGARQSCAQQHLHVAREHAERSLNDMSAMLRVGEGPIARRDRATEGQQRSLQKILRRLDRVVTAEVRRGGAGNHTAWGQSASHKVRVWQTA